MKPVHLSPLLLLLALSIPARGEDAPPPPPPAEGQQAEIMVVPVPVPPPDAPAAPRAETRTDAQPAPAVDAKPAPAPAAEVKPAAVPAADAKPANGDTAPAPAPIPDPIILPDGRFVMEFRGARLGQVLDYLSKAAGYVIANAVDLPNPITLVAKKPLTTAEALEALNGVLLDQGYTAIVRGKTLRVVPLAGAKQQNLPVETGNDPANIPESDRMVTQIIPVRFATAKDLAENLAPLLNTATATMSANESSNSLILTDTQTNIRRIVSIVHAIDTSIISEQQVKVFHLKFASADKVATVINNIYGSSSSSRNNRGNAMNQFLPPFMQQNQGGRGSRGGSSGNDTSGQGRGGDVSAAADTGTNSVVIRAGAGSMTALDQVIKELDVDTSAKDGVLLYRVKNGKSANIAKSLNSLFSSTQSTSAAGGSTTTRAGQIRQATQGATTAMTATGDSALDLSGQVRVVSDDVSNSVLVLSSERNFERLQKVLTDLDIPMRQVLIRVLVAEVTIEKGLQLGVQMEGVNNQPVPADGSVPGPASDATRFFSDFNLFDQTLGMNGFILNSTHFRAAIRALATDSRFDVLSRPYVLTTDNQKATVNVSQEVPIITGTRVDQQGNAISTFERQDVGIILTVTPQINHEGRVLLDVTQELSALTDQTVPVAKDVLAPITKKRTTTTRVSVDHGQTVVVGGLVHDSMVEAERGVPVLKDIPFLGALFRYTSRTKAQTELLIFLTPQVVKDPADLANLGVQLRNEMSRLDAAVEQGTLQTHLDQLMNSRVGEAIAPPPARPGRPLAEPAPAGGKP